MVLEVVLVLEDEEGNSYVKIDRLNSGLGMGDEVEVR